MFVPIGWTLSFRLGLKHTWLFAEGVTHFFSYACPISSFCLFLWRSGASVSRYERSPGTHGFTSFWIRHLARTSHSLSEDDGQVVEMAVAVSCGWEDTLRHVAGVSELALFAWERGQIWRLTKSPSAVLPYGKMDNLMKGSLAACAKQAYIQHKWPVSAEHFLTAYPADIFK